MRELAKNSGTKRNWERWSAAYRQYLQKKPDHHRYLEKYCQLILSQFILCPDSSNRLASYVYVYF